MSDWVQGVAGQWLANMTDDVTRYVIFSVAVWLILWVVLKGLLRPRKIREDTPPARQLALEFLISIRSIAIFSTVGVSMFILEHAGLFPGPALAAQWGLGWAVASFALMVIAHDAWFYWSHRLMHDPRLFRRMHRRHHLSHNPSPFTAYSFDLGEAVVMAAFVPLWMVLVPTPWPVVGLFMLHQIARNTLAHSGYELMPADRHGRPMFGFLTTTTHHDMHHQQAGWNYGFYFTWWDKLMGTEHPEYHARFAEIAGRTRTSPGLNATVAKATSLLFIAAIAAGFTAPSSEAQSSGTSQGIAGRWATQGFGSIVEFAPCADATDRICGRIQWLWDDADASSHPRTDRKNPDKALRARSLVGVEIIRGLQETEPGVWSNGALYNPDDGRTYTGVARLRDGLLDLQGCALGVFCQTQTWRRAEDVIAAAMG